MPRFGKGPEFDIPSCIPELTGVIQRYKHLFSTVPGSTNMTFHTIETADNAPIHVPPRLILADFRDKIQHHCKTCLLETSIESAAAHGWLLQCTFQRRMVTYISAYRLQGVEQENCKRVIPITFTR